MKIKPIFTTTVTKDTHNADGSLWIPKGSSLSICSSFKSKKFGEFSLTTPNPVHLFLASADSFIKEIKIKENQINDIDKILVFSKFNDGVHKYTTGELLKLDPEATKIRNLGSDILYEYLYLGFGCLVSLLSSLEAFVNQEIPLDYQTIIKDKNGKEREINKSDIEKMLRLEEKLDILANSKSIKGYKQTEDWKDFKYTKELRDSLVHLKTNGSNMVNRNDEVIGKVFDFDFIKHRNSIINLINTFISGYVDGQN